MENVENVEYMLPLSEEIRKKYENEMAAAEAIVDEALKAQKAVEDKYASLILDSRINRIREIRDIIVDSIKEGKWVEISRLNDRETSLYMFKSVTDFEKSCYDGHLMFSAEPTKAVTLFSFREFNSVYIRNTDEDDRMTWKSYENAIIDKDYTIVSSEYVMDLIEKSKSKIL